MLLTAQGLCESLDIQNMSVFPQMLPVAAAAREKYGAGRYGLNFSDCLSYAAARHFHARLIFVGKDFAKTDVNDS